MARCEFSGPDEAIARLEVLSRDGVKRIVMAGGEACKTETKARIERYRHVVTGSMLNSVAAGKYYEDINSGFVYVYPQGNDNRGVSNAKKAFVINYGYGKRRTQKTGDKFITGKKNTMQKVVSAAMQAESDRIVQEMNGG